MATGLKGEARDSRATLGRAGRGVVSTLAGRGVALAATYVFYVILSRSLPVADFGRLVYALTIVRIGATLARRGLDQALLVAMPRGPANRLAVRTVVSTAAALATATILGLLLVQHALPGFAIPLAVALPMVALAELVVGALRARGSVTLAATAEGLAQPLAAVAFAWMAAQAAPSITTFAVAYLASWLAPILFARRLDWSGPPLDPEAARLAEMRGGGRTPPAARSVTARPACRHLGGSTNSMSPSEAANDASRMSWHRIRADPNPCSSSARAMSRTVSCSRA